MREPIYTVWFKEGRRLEWLSESKMREEAKRYGFDPQEVVDSGETHIWWEDAEPNDDPTEDETIGGCFKSTFEYVVHSYQEPSRTRYRSAFSNDWNGDREEFQSEELAFQKAFDLIRGGAFDVSIQADLVNPDETICDFEPLPCPYQELGIDPELQELKHHKEEVETALTWAVMDGTDKVEEYSETLAKINREIDQIATSADGSTSDGLTEMKVPYGLEVQP